MNKKGAAPGIGAALAAAILGERLSPVGFAGSALVILAVLLASREARGEPVTGPDLVPE